MRAVGWGAGRGEDTEGLGMVGVEEADMREDTREGEWQDGEKDKSGKPTKEILLLRYAAVELKLV